MPLIENLQITNFKCFKQLDVKGLGQVNLIGGKNNVGKTAFLEAIELLASSNKSLELASSLFSITARRQQCNPTNLLDLDFFYENQSEITFKSGSKICEITHSLHTPQDNDNEDILPFELLTFHLNDEIKEIRIDKIQGSPPIIVGQNKQQHVFVSSARIREKDIAIMLGALTDLGIEDFLNDSLALFDNNFSGLKLIVKEKGVVLKMKLNNKKELVLLSSLGEGINRYIAILCAIWANKDGFLLIDEIENGIHFTNYPKLWEIIFKTSIEANCQLFITTHSKECITAFNDMQFEVENCNAQYFEFYKNLKTDLIVASSRDKEQLQYALTHEGRVRGE